MKSFNKYLIAVLVLTMLASAQLFGQEWSAKQKEVWKNVEAYWQMEADRNLDGFMSYFHEDYSGWFNLSALPSGKAETRKFVAQDFANSEVLVQDIKPVAIKVHGDFAIVHYYYSQLSQNKEGKKSMQRGNWTDILMKQGNKWVLIGDHGGPMPEDD